MQAFPARPMTGAEHSHERAMPELRHSLPGAATRLAGAALLAVCLVVCAHTNATAQPDNRTGMLLTDRAFDPQSYPGKKTALFLFSLDDPRAGQAVGLMNELYALRNEYNFEVFGLCLDADTPEAVTTFNQQHAVPFPVFLDRNREFSQSINMRGGIGICIFDRQGRREACRWGAFTPAQVDLAGNWRSFASTYLQFGHVPEDEPLLGYRPPLPHIAGRTLQGAQFDTRAVFPHKPLVITIFSPRCTHCVHELVFLNRVYTTGDLAGRFEMLAISRLDQKNTEAFIKQQAFSFPVLIDTANRYSALFPSFTGTIPQSYVVDSAGRIAARHTGFNRETADLFVMELRKLTGLANPPLLVKDGYSGHKRCGVCHEKEHIQWSLTRHADAIDSLVRKGSENDPACIACHVTGYGTVPQGAPQLQGVQCEACHGPGSTSCGAFTAEFSTKKSLADWRRLCVTCHTDKESLNFVFGSRYPRILHETVPDLSAMTRLERQAFIRTYREKKNLFDSPARYVGAQSCKVCHEAEYSHWETTPHACVHQTPAADAAPPEKLHRFHTGFNLPGGYPEPGREGVQCEACHGPGENHLKDPQAKGPGTIVSLGGTCTSCVVEQICRSCHTPDDDPGFTFDTAIEKVRHPKD
jgi:peroxiredoxin